jgi:GNAT superfamily N-acetyltransferase
MTTRMIEAADLPELFDLRAVTRENPYSRDDLRKIGITVESSAAALRTTHRGWLCESDGVKAGFAIGDGKTGEMCVIAVLPAFEGRGVGSRLLQLVETWLYSLGWKDLWLWTSPDTRMRAHSFYTKRGWAVAEKKEGVIYMRKNAPLSSPGAAPPVH